MHNDSRQQAKTEGRGWRMARCKGSILHRLSSILLPYLCVSVCICGSLAFAQSPSFTPPAETFLSKNQLAPLQQAIANKDYADAAQRIDALIHESAEQFMSVDGGSLVSVRLWVESLPASARLAVMAEMDKLVGDPARAAVDAALLRPGRRPEDLVSAGADFPLTSATRDAIGQAALRALDLGDTATASLLAGRAKDLGWKPSTAQQQTLDAIKPPAAGAVPLPVAAPWYGQNPPQPARRVIPVIAGNTIFISTERTVMAAKASGELIWKYEAPKPETVMTAAQLGLHRPTVMCDLAGQPQIVLVRHVLGATRFGCLRAFRASDGKLLWSSESSPVLSGWSLATLPTVAGRHAWVLAADETQRPAPLMLLAIEVMTGRLAMQCQLGTYLNSPEAGGGGADIEKLWDHSGVAIDGGDVFVSAGSGLIARVDRLDARIRWARIYESQLTPGEKLRDLARRSVREYNARGPLKKMTEELRRKAAELNVGGPPPKRPGPGEKPAAVPDDAAQLADLFSQPHRWLSTPAAVGEVLVAAPVDFGSVLGIDRGSGAVLWDNPELSTQTLLGVSGHIAVFAGESLTGIDARTGKAKWTWNESPIEGVPALAGQTLRVPTAGGKLVVLSAETGQADALTGVGPTIAPVLKNEASKSFLTGAEAISALGAARPAKR